MSGKLGSLLGTALDHISSLSHGGVVVFVVVVVDVFSVVVCCLCVLL